MCIRDTPLVFPWAAASLDVLEALQERQQPRYLEAWDAYSILCIKQKQSPSPRYLYLGHTWRLQHPSPGTLRRLAETLRGNLVSLPTF